MRISLFLLSSLLILGTEATRSEELKLLLDLRGKWKFEIGDNLNRASRTFEDGNWAEIDVPSPWEDEGFPGYDGYGWYRKHFRIPHYSNDKVLYLVLGNVDDVDEVYVNGRMIGFYGSFPPHYVSAYNVWRQYRLLTEYLNPDGDNVVAVRVYDQELSGGITRGKVGIYEMKDALEPDLPLLTGWKFKTGDDMTWREVGVDDRQWNSITVPAYWETQGNREYDGYGWYRLRFSVPPQLENQRLVLMLGKIDDFDQTFLNGQRIGATGSMPALGTQMRLTNDYLQLRAYAIAPELLRKDGDNVLAVRVYDGFFQGGIYDGPIGLVRWDRYQHWRDRQSRPRSTVQKILDWFFR